MNSWVPTLLKNNGGLSSSRVGARRSSGRSPASSGVGRPLGGARTLAPLYSEPALLAGECAQSFTLVPFCLVSMLPDLQEIPRRTRI